MDILKITNTPYYKKGNTIHIKKENRGKFTKSAKEHNMGVQEFATHVLNNKDEYSPTLIKRANFAKNSKKFKHTKGGLIKKCREGEILDNQQIYTAGYSNPVTVTASKPTEKEWLEYIKNNNITTRSKEYTKLPEKIRSLVVQEEIRRKRDKSVLPTVAAITLPTLIPAVGAQLVSSGALTAADTAGKVGTKIAGTNLGKAAGTFINNPYIDMGLTSLGAYTIPSLYNSGVSNIKQGNYGRALGDFMSIGLEGLGALGTIKNIKNVYRPINKMMNDVQPELKKYIPEVINNHEIKYIPTEPKINKDTYIDFYNAEKLLKEKQALDFKMAENNKLLDLLDAFSQKHAVAEIGDNNMKDVVLTYPKADRNTITSNRRTNKQIRNVIARHNTFARGVQMPTAPEDIERIRKIFGDDWMNKKDEVLKYVATHVRPGDGLYISPLKNSSIYGNESRGSLNLVRRKYKLGKDRSKWFEEGDFVLQLNPAFSGISWDDITDIVAPWKNPKYITTGKIPYRESELISPKDMYWVKTVKGDLNQDLPTSFNTTFDWNRYK